MLNFKFLYGNIKIIFQFEQLMFVQAVASNWHAHSY